MRRSLVPDIVNLQAFECAARHENFSRAAEELHLTQGAVSRQIAELEKQTGLKLFERVRRRVILSDAGERLLPQVKEFLVHAENLMIGAVAAGTMTASLRIAALPTFASKWLVPRLTNFTQLHPDVAVTIESRSSPFSFSDEHFDLAIHFGQPVWAGATSTFLCHETVLPMANKVLAEHLTAHGDNPVCEAPLLHLITRPRLWSDWAKIHDMHIANAYHGPRFDQFSMVAAAAMGGMGVALLPTYLVEEELRSGSLVPLLNLPMQTDNAYYVVRPENKQTQQSVEDFVGWILSEI